MVIILNKHWKVFAIGCLVVLNAALVGMVYVLHSNASTDIQYQESLAALENVNGTFDELGKFFLTLAEEEGGVYAFEVLKRAILPPNIDLHLLGHIVGDELYKQQGIEGMKYCTHDFRNACSHTVVIGALLENGMQVFDEVHEVCKQAPGGKGAYTMCFHGFGHGVLAYAEYEVPDAVELCKRVGTPEYHNQEYFECAGGITMEMISGVHDPDLWEEKKKKYMPGENPLELCTNGYFPDEVKNACLVYITPQLMLAAGADLGAPDPSTFETAFAFCDALPKDDTRSRTTCYGGFGKEFTVLAQDRDIRKMHTMSNDRLSLVYEWCGMANNEDGERACRNDALNSLYWGGENDVDLSIRFCGVMEEDDAAMCYAQLIENVRFYIDDPDYRQNFCAALPSSFRAQCNNRLE